LIHLRTRAIIIAEYSLGRETSHELFPHQRVAVCAISTDTFAQRT
jgi:hypothetical protein